MNNINQILSDYNKLKKIIESASGMEQLITASNCNRNFLEKWTRTDELCTLADSMWEDCNKLIEVKLLKLQ